MSKGIMRVSSSDLLVKQFGRDVVDVLKSEEFGKIFPYFSVDRFSKKTEDEFQFIDSKERNYLCITRDSRIVGFRIDYLITDDLIGGTNEAMKTELHNSIKNKYLVDWTSRAKNEEDFKIVSVGTMFSPYDLLNWLKENAEDTGDIVETQFKEYVEVYRDRITGKLNVFITIPALDEYDNSTLECEFSSVTLRKKREQLLSDKGGNGEYNWYAVYMQKPKSPTGLSFSYENLQIYEELPKKDGKSVLAPYNIAVIDPNRKGNDFLSMPIFNPVEDKFYLLDVLFKKDAISEMYDEIIEKIVRFNIIKLYIEINTDTSLPTVLSDRLKAKGHNCEIIEIFSTVNKEQKIKDNQGNVKNKLVFPSRKYWKKNHELFKAMEQMTSYSFERANKHDDFIDSCSIFIMNETSNLNSGGFLELIDRRILDI